VHDSYIISPLSTSILHWFYMSISTHMLISVLLACIRWNKKKKVYTIKSLLNLFPLSHVPFIRLTNYSVPFVQLFLYSTHKWSMKWILICPSENGAGNIFIHLLTFSSTWIKLFNLAVIKISVQFRLVQSWNSCTPHLRWNLQVPPIAIFSWRIWAWLCWLEAWSSVGCSSPATNFQPPLKKN